MPVGHRHASRCDADGKWTCTSIFLHFACVNFMGLLLCVCFSHFWCSFDCCVLAGVMQFFQKLYESQTQQETDRILAAQAKYGKPFVTVANAWPCAHACADHTESCGWKYRHQLAGQHRPAAVPHQDNQRFDPTLPLKTTQNNPVMPRKIDSFSPGETHLSEKRATGSTNSARSWLDAQRVAQQQRNQV